MPGAQEIDPGLKYRDISITITFDPEQSKAPVNILQICWKPVLCRYMSKMEKS